ncbi:MAG: hypothetical protein N3C60_03010 [Calditerrivibrio sp.]|nr:hypothetical protein [Calditerrivibrio sp.]
MRIACIQEVIYTGLADKNIDTFVSKILSCEADIVLLPEMWFCGFDYTGISDHASRVEEIICLLKSNAVNKLIVCSMPEKAIVGIYNTTYGITSDGVIATYRKQFLFSPQREDQYFLKSDENITTFKYKDVNFAMATCYEIRFPEIFRISAYEGAEVYLVPAIWPAAKSLHWLTLLRARAIENQAYVVGCSCSKAVKNDKELKCGYSAGFDPWGEELFCLGEESGIAYVDIDRSKITTVREQIPSLNDAKKCFVINKKPHWRNA